MGFKDFMEEKKPISRWMVLNVGLIGMFCGAVLTVLVMLSGVLLG